MGSSSFRWFSNEGGLSDENGRTPEDGEVPEGRRREAEGPQSPEGLLRAWQHADEREGQEVGLGLLLGLPDPREAEEHKAKPLSNKEKRDGESG